MFEIYKFVRVFKKVGGSNSVCFLFRISIFCSRFSKFVPIVSKIVSCFQKNTRISKRNRNLINCMCFLISLSNVVLRCFPFVIYTLALPMFHNYMFTKATRKCRYPFTKIGHIFIKICSEFEILFVFCKKV